MNLPRRLVQAAACGFATVAAAYLALTLNASFTGEGAWALYFAAVVTLAVLAVRTLLIDLTKGRRR